MSLPVVVQYKPYYQELTKGRTYFWCSCGLSKRQPFCDGSHRDTGFEPVIYKAQQDNEEVLFCGCKKSATQPFCDGSHNNLIGGYETDNPNSPANRLIPSVTQYQQARAQLDGDCYITAIDQIELNRHQNIHWATLISQQTAAQYQSLCYFLLPPDKTPSPSISFADSEVVLLVAQGQAELIISGHRFELSTYTAAHIRGGETFSLCNTGNTELKMYLSSCPPQENPRFSTRPGNFNTRFLNRTVSMDASNRQEMGDRFFQLLVNKAMRASKITQFIGEIPQSMSAFHRHLYEETLVILRGEGVMWTEHSKTAIGTGDTVFLPRKQTHSLQCTDPKGLLLMGVICPGDNPAINY